METSNETKMKMQRERWKQRALVTIDEPNVLRWEKPWWEM